MAEFLSWYYLIINWFTIAVLGGLSFALFRSFRIKKTTGTLMLFTAYFALFIARLLGAIQITIQVITGNYGEFSLHSTAISIVIPVSTVIFLYAFSCRGIFKDSEYIRTFTIIVLSVTVGVSFTLLFTNLYVEIPEGLFSIDYKNISAEITTYSVPFVIFLVLAVEILVYLRITISSFILAKNSDEITRKRGFQFIAIGTSLFLIAGTMIAVMNAFELSTSIFIVLETSRRIMIIISYFMLYVGWTLPDWFRKRLRRKSWFEKQYITPVQ